MITLKGLTRHIKEDPGHTFYYRVESGEESTLVQRRIGSTCNQYGAKVKCQTIYGYDSHFKPVCLLEVKIVKTAGNRK